MRAHPLLTRQRAQQEAGHGETDLVKTALRLTQIHHRNGVWRGGVALLPRSFTFSGHFLEGTTHAPLAKVLL